MTIRPVPSRSEWISVTDSLPPTDKSVAILIADPDSAIYHWPTCAYRRVVHRGTKWEETEWWAGVPGKYMKLPALGWSVTHWSALPELPAKPWDMPGAAE